MNLAPESEPGKNRLPRETRAVNMGNERTTTAAKRESKAQTKATAGMNEGFKRADSGCPFGRSAEEFIQRHGSKLAVAEDTAQISRKYNSLPTPQTETEYMQARQAAFIYIGISLRSSGKVREKLCRRGFGDAVIEQVLQDLINEKYIDDLRLARNKLRLRRSRDGESRLMLYQRLLRAGIEADCAATAIDELPQDDETTAVAYIRSRFCREVAVWRSEMEEAEARPNAIHEYNISNKFFYRPDVVKVVRNIIRHGFKPDTAIRSLRFVLQENTQI